MGLHQRSGIKTKFEASSAFGRLDRDVELALFRVLQESLTNVTAIPAAPKPPSAWPRKMANFVLEISDRGKGIPFQKFEEAGRDWMGSRGVGLRGMTERIHQIGGRLEISSTDQGTVVRAIVPGSANSTSSGNPN